METPGFSRGEETPATFPARAYEKLRENVSVSRSTVKRAFKYRFYPTQVQAAELSRTFGRVRLVYNRALAERTAAWFTEQRRVDYNEASAALTQ